MHSLIPFDRVYFLKVGFQLFSIGTVNIRLDFMILAYRVFMLIFTLYGVSLQLFMLNVLLCYFL